MSSDIKPNYLNSSTKKYELEGGYYVPNYRNVNENLKPVNSPLKGFHNHYFFNQDLSSSSSDAFKNRKEFYDKVNSGNFNDPDDTKHKYIQ
jgi:hypothetical protein